jgi:hypothetical protein
MLCQVLIAIQAMTMCRTTTPCEYGSFTAMSTYSADHFRDVGDHFSDVGGITTMVGRHINNTMLRRTGQRTTPHRTQNLIVWNDMVNTLDILRQICRKVLVSIFGWLTQVEDCLDPQRLYVPYKVTQGRCELTTRICKIQTRLKQHPTSDGLGHGVMRKVPVFAARLKSRSAPLRRFQH